MEGLQFTAEEIEREAKAIDEKLVVFERYTDRLTDYFVKIEQLIRSTDSNLAEKIGDHRTEYYDVQDKIMQRFNELSSAMHKYASETVSNEQTSSEQVTNITNKVGDIAHGDFSKTGYYDASGYHGPQN